MGARGRLIVLALAGVAAVFPPVAQEQAGKPIPEYTTGDECLFCHRTGIVPETWEKNPHALTIHPDEADPAKQILGARGHFRALKKSGYGKFALLDPASKAWDPDKFANRCAGCHTTAFNSSTKTFGTSALDCYTCHGVANMDHTKDKSLMWLSTKHARDPKLITSLCAQCHLRGAVSKSTGFPFANNFIAGEDLFGDLRVDWKLAADPALNPGDRHVYENVRDVVENEGMVTCLSCHKIHGDSGQKHRLVLTGPICLECHNEAGPKNAVKKYEVHSTLCEY